MKYKKVITCLCICIVFSMTACNNQNAVENTETTIETTPVETRPQVIEPQSGGTLRISIRNPKTLNPLLNEDESIDQFLNLIYDKLIELDEHQRPQANIATSWALSADGKILTLKIRNDIKWHDGSSLTADDIIFSLDTIKSSAETSAYKACIKNIESYESSDHSTVIIHYNKPFSGYLYALSFPIISQKYYAGEEVLTSSRNMSPVGTGAYTFDSMTTMKEIKLNKNNSWFKGLPYIDSINAVIIPKEDAQLYAFEQRQIDLITTDVVDWEKYGVTKETNMDEYTTNYYEFIGLNFNKALYNDKLVRQALAYAMPREAILSTIYLDHAVLTDTPINPISWLNSTQIKYSLDTTKSKNLLKQAGWADSNSNGILDKNGEEFKMTLLVDNENAQRVEAASVIKEALKPLGIDVSIDSQSFINYQQRLYAKDFDAFLGGWKLSTIPDLSFAFHSSNIETGLNFISYNNETINVLLDTASNAINEAAMQQAYKNLENYIVEEVPYVSLYFRNAAVLANGRVKGELRSNVDNIYVAIKDWFIYQN